MAAEAAISSLLQLLGNRLIQEVKFLRGVKVQIQLLKDELKRMQSFLEFANGMLLEDPRVSNWISEIREVAQDAEDTIDMFLINAENARKGSFLKKCTSFANCVCHLHTIGGEIESILAKLNSIDRSRVKYGIDGLGEETLRLKVESRRRLAQWQKVEHLVGMEGDVEKVMRESILDEEKNGLCVVAVEGMGGIGKSTLAREIYNHREVVAGGGFECRGWVVVSSEFRPVEAMKQLILQLPRSEGEKQKQREIEESTKDEMYLQQFLQEMVHKLLKGRKYFIVVDDLWEEEHWEILRTAFPDEQDKASRILLTSRNKVVTNYGAYVHKMKLLEPDKCWELFLKKAHINKCPQELELIGRKIVEKCEGLPLAINMVGGLVMQTQTKNGWEQVLNNMNSHLRRGKSSVSTILELSYLNLSPQLKSCFLCLAFFKKDVAIPTESLVHIWIGHGLIQKEESTTDYLEMLVDRNMLQIKTMTFDDRVKYCHLHDLLREVCVRKAKEEMGFSDEGISSESSSNKFPRHYVVHGEGFSLNHRNKHLRSLFLLNCRIGEYNFHYCSFQLLKILNLDGFELQTLPRSFRSLIGLKYLRIHSDSNNSLELPTWLDLLQKLEILDTSGKRVKFPDVTLRMERLSYFCGYCVRGPKSIVSWKNIETLKYIRLEDWMRCSSSPRLTDECRVRELGIVMEAEEMGSDEKNKIRVSLEKMKNLEQLHLIYRPYFVPMCNLSNLTKLKLSGKLGKCPTANMFPPNISYIVLDWSELEDDPMRELGTLKTLLYLKLHKHAYIGEKMKVLKDGFPKLEALSLVYMDKLRGVDVEEGGMPKLRQLRVSSCPVLETKNFPEHIISVISIS